MDPLIYSRGLERIIIVGGAIFFGYLGYRLYLFGVERGRSHLAAESKFFKFVLSATGPGLFFMAFGSVVLVYALLTGGGDKTKTTETFMPPIKSEAQKHTLAPPDPNERPFPLSRQRESMTVHDVLPPAVPTGFAASSISTSQINLSWWIPPDDPYGIVQYWVFRCTGASCIDMRRVAWVPGGVPTYQDTGLTANTAYVYTVVAVDRAGNASNKSAKATATTFSTPHGKNAAQKN